jgi:hypothetical protein
MGVSPGLRGRLGGRWRSTEFERLELRDYRLAASLNKTMTQETRRYPLLVGKELSISDTDTVSGFVETVNHGRHVIFF